MKIREMTPDELWELFARGAEISSQLAQIGEDKHAKDVSALVQIAIECAAHH